MRPSPPYRYLVHGTHMGRSGQSPILTGRAEAAHYKTLLCLNVAVVGLGFTADIL